MAGSLLLLAALALTAYNLWDQHRAGVQAQQVLEQLSGAVQQPQQGLPDYLLAPEMAMPAMEVDGELYIGVLEIPALGLVLPVMSEWSYPRLKIAPCRYTGSAYTGDLVIAAHNYRSHFGQIKKLAIGEKIYFTDIEGNRFSYEVGEMEVLDPAAVESMTQTQWELTLFTCTLGGENRVALRCASAGQ